MKFKIIALCLCFIYSLNVEAQKEKKNTYEQKLFSMFKLSGSNETYKSIVNGFVNIQKLQNDELDNSTWEIIRSEFLASSIDQLIVMLVPVYKKYLTESDLDELIKFYNSDIGKKFSKINPIITSESIMVGKEWGKIIRKQILEKVNKKKQKTLNESENKTK
ncbi:MAG: DUF2059 domain-containing protein [Marinifilaceae bacterium]|jgi:hypothetical protein|nr:DUF2059 domain-containing protein [Marinifilaceae bacterium]